MGSEGVIYFTSSMTIAGTMSQGGSGQLDVSLTLTATSWTTPVEPSPNPWDWGTGSFSVSFVNGFSQSYSLPSGWEAGIAAGATGLQGTVTITLQAKSYTTLSCTPFQLVVDKANCEVDVYGSSPTGTVTVSASSDATDLGQRLCGPLVPDPSGTFSSCFFAFTSPVEGDFNVTASYPGDGNNPSSSAWRIVTFVKPDQGEAADLALDRVTTNMSLSCSPSVVNETLQATCTARVSGTSPAPAGNVAWSAANPSGVLSNSSCTLAGGSCGVAYFQGNSSQVATITASYPGDATHLPKKASATISVLGVGTTTLDQRQSSGFVIKVTGTSGSTVTTTSTYYYVQPNDTGTAPFASDQYYDLRVFGAVNGDVQVCHYGAEVNASTSLDYYYNGAWQAATDITATPGMSVCGDIPASALSGTILAIGGLSTSTSTTTTTTASSPTSTSTTHSSSATVTSTITASSSATSTPTTSGGGGIPEFPYQLLAVTAFVALLSVSYLMVRRRRLPRGPRGPSAQLR